MASVSKDLILVREQIEKLKIKEKQLLKRDKENERKARTKRLIERGALIEKYFSIDNNFSNENFDLLLKNLFNNNDFISIFSKIKNGISEEINITNQEKENEEFKGLI